MSSRITKACQTCRRRKVKCNGEQPCNHCTTKPETCAYRVRVRPQKSNRPSSCMERESPSSAARPLFPEPTQEDTYPATGSSHHEEVCHSVSATQASGASGIVQLYYGASSQFAFLQQILRGIPSGAVPSNPYPGPVQDITPGLELFSQMGFFFGTGPFLDQSAESPGTSLWDELPLELGMSFVDTYMDIAYPLAPFMREQEIRALTRSFCGHEHDHDLQPHSKAIIMIVLAIGATGTDKLGLADTLFSKAKVEAVAFDDVVNLHTVQISILFGLYQGIVGRTNSVYLHLGTACRKAFAMGLHMDMCGTKTAGSSTDEMQQQQRITIWCLYFHECYQSLAMGRRCAIQHSDILCPLPSNSSLVCHLAQLARIMTRSVETVYNRQMQSSWNSFKAAEKIRIELREFAEQHNLASVYREDAESKKDINRVFLHNLYYHTILITFRPFLVADAVRCGRVQRENGQQISALHTALEGEEMWLRQACRYAVDAAQDQILFLCNKVHTIKSLKKMRYNCFFIESSCAVLLYDILWQRSKYSHNLEYINAGLNYMSQIPFGDPVQRSMNSIKQVLSVVEQEIFRQQPMIASQAPLSGNQHGGQTSTDTDSNINLLDPAANFLPLPTTNGIIHTRDRMDAPNPNLPEMDYNLDIFATDLYHLFPTELEANTVDL